MPSSHSDGHSRAEALHRTVQRRNEHVHLRFAAENLLSLEPAVTEQMTALAHEAAQVAERQRQLFERQEAAGLHLLKLQRLRHGLGALVDRWKQVKCTYLP
jgi:hypothetical protein